MEDSAKEEDEGLNPTERRWLMGLTAAALLSRLVWVLWVHPPEQHVFSDMGRYVGLAQDLVEDGFRRDPHRAFWPWGAPALMAPALALFGDHGLRAAGLLWGLFSACVVPMAYLLGRLAHRRFALPAGLFALCWLPDLSHAGFFLSETPYRAFLMMHTLGLAMLARRGTGGWLAGVGGAVAFAVRPQSALFTGLAALAWWLLWRERVPARRLLGVALPLAAVFAFSLWRFHAHTGRLGIAENGSPNLTVGRCHVAYLQAFETARGMERARARKDYRAGSRVGVPSMGQLARLYPEDHPLALRPALGDPSLRFVGRFADPKIQAELRAQCYAATGWAEQARMSLANLHLLWFTPDTWPESRSKVPWLNPLVDGFHRLFRYVLLAPSLLGLGLALARPRRDPALTLCALHLVALMVLAAVFFGELRFRATTDVYAFLLALSAGAAAKNAWSMSSKR